MHILRVHQFCVCVRVVMNGFAFHESVLMHVLMSNIVNVQSVCKGLHFKLLIKLIVFASEGCYILAITCTAQSKI